MESEESKKSEAGYIESERRKDKERGIGRGNEGNHVGCGGGKNAQVREGAKDSGREERREEYCAREARAIRKRNRMKA